MIKCIKKIINFSANITACLGLLILVFGFYILYNQVGLNYSNLYYNTADWLKTLQEYGFIILGVLIILIGLAGMRGASKKKPSCKKACLLCYEIGAITFFVLFTGLAVFTLVYSDDIFGKECTATEYFKKVNDQLSLADQLFCSSACQCYVKEETLKKFNSTVFQDKQTTQDETLKDKFQVQKCQDFQEETYGAAAQLMQTAEVLFSCTGWCTATPYYIFSDINEGVPDGECCYDKTKAFVESNGKILGYVLLGLAILFGLTVFLVLALCCMSDKKRKPRDQYIAM